jgi:hypothetical protein
MTNEGAIMMDTLAHSFDCECDDCLMKDVVTTRPIGMDLFRKPRNVERTLAPVTTLPSVKEPIRRLPAGQRVGNGRVRKISERQERYILKLIKERDLTNLKIITGQTLDPDEIPFMGVKGASALIEKMLGCPIKGTNSPVMENSPNTIPGSEKQVKYIKDLFTQLNLSESDVNTFLKTFPTPSALISNLLKMPKPNKEILLKKEIDKARDNEEYVPTEIIPGYYRDIDSQVWKVQFNQSRTGMYALKRINKRKYEYTAGAIKELTPSMFVSLNPLDVTLEEAKEYGRKTGTCYMCSRELTNPVSIENGIGPICASKF